MAQGNKTAMTVILSIIFAVLFITLANVSISLIFEQPDYNDFCDPALYQHDVLDQDALQQCNKEYSDALSNFNSIRFYILIGLGTLFIILGIFVPFALATWTGLGTGLVFLGEAVAFNYENKLSIVVTVLLTIILIGVAAWRMLGRRK